MTIALFGNVHNHKQGISKNTTTKNRFCISIFHIAFQSILVLVIIDRHVNKVNKDSIFSLFVIFFSNKVELPRIPSEQPSGSWGVPRTQPHTSAVSARMRLQQLSRNVQLMTVSMPGNSIFVVISILEHLLSSSKKCK